LLLGNKKESIAQFSFLMVLAPILGDALIETIHILQGEVVANIPLSSLLIGFLAAYISGCFACKFMIRIVQRGKLIYFAAYCLIAGGLAILLS
jgi:undecaprenyl-diphosphatase